MGVRHRFDLAEAQPLLRGTVFTDRGVYKLGEEVHFKAVLRSDTPKRHAAPARRDEGRDRRPRQPRQGSRPAHASRSTNGAARSGRGVPADGPLGTYTIFATVPRSAPAVDGDFLVAAYRRPDFRVDVDAHRRSTVAGTKLDGKITGRYLFGAPMAERDR